jgi:hypothetical protein
MLADKKWLEVMVFWLMICWLCLGNSHGWGDCLLVERDRGGWLVGGMVFGLEDV